MNSTSMAKNLFDTCYLIGENYWNMVELDLSKMIEQHLYYGDHGFSDKFSARETARAEAKRIVQAARAKYDISGLVS